MDKIDELRMRLDELPGRPGWRMELNEVEEWDTIHLLDDLMGIVGDLLNVLAERQGPGGESAFVVHHDSPSPLVTCDGVKECCIKHPERCEHSKPHKKTSMCSEEHPRCSDSPPPLGVCR